MVAFEIVERDAQAAAVVRGRVPLGELPDFFGRAYGAVMEALSAQGVSPTGPPFGFYPSQPGEVVEVHAGFPVAGPVETSGEVVAMELPAGRVVTTVHVGPYDTLDSTYTELQSWMTEQRIKPAAQMWEIYVSDPAVEPPDQWRTEIVWPIAE